MKLFHVLSVVICFSLTFSLFCSLGNALEQNELIVSVVMQTQNVYPGSATIASVFLVNNSTEILTIQYLGLQFDWMPSDQFMGLDLSNDPVVIPSSTHHIFDVINIVIPQDASVGEHTYFMGVDGLQGATDLFSWNSQTLTLVVQDPEQGVYNDLSTQVSHNIAVADDKNFQSSKAQSLLQQAKDTYSQALAFAEQNSWDEAISMLNSASAYLEQTDVEEQKNLEEKSSQDSLLIIVGVAVVLALVILAIYLMRRKKSSKILASNPKSHTYT